MLSRRKKTQYHSRKQGDGRLQIPATCGPSSTTNWWPIVVGGIQFLIGIGLTFYTFRKNALQKTEERRASWYHKVVVDRAIPLLFTYSDLERAALEKAALDCEMAKFDQTATALEIDAKYASALADFQSRLRPLRAELTNLALVFDRKLFEGVQSVTLTLDDAVSEWFYQAKNIGTLRVAKSVGDILSDFHRDVLTTIREYEFKVMPISK